MNVHVPRRRNIHDTAAQALKPLKPAERDIPKRAYSRCSPRIPGKRSEMHRVRQAVGRSAPSYLRLACVYNPLVYGQGESMSVCPDGFPSKKKNRSICVLFRGGCAD